MADAYPLPAPSVDPNGLIAALNKCLLCLGPEHEQNLARLVAAVGEILDASCAAYTVMSAGAVKIRKCWGLPATFQGLKLPGSTLCQEVVERNEPRCIVVPDLQTHPAGSDNPLVCEMGLRTYVGHVVRVRGKPVGALCAVFKDVRRLAPAEEYVIGALAVMLGVEEERYEAVQALRASEEKARAVLEAALDAIVMIDERGRVTYWNSAAEKLFGYTAEEILGQELHLLLAPEELHASWRKGLKEFAYTGKGPVIGKLTELEAVAKGGRRVHVELSVSAMRLHDRWHAVAVIRDVSERKRLEQEREQFQQFLEAEVARRTAELRQANERLKQEIAERKQTEAALRRSRERLRALVEATSDWVWEIDAERRYTYCSAKVRDILGYEPQEMLGRTPFEFMPPEEARRVKAKFDEIFRRGEPFHGLENLNIHKDGRLVVIETSGLPVFDDNGTLVGFRGIDRDITKRKQAERLLQHAKKELERKVQERTAELEEANRKLQEEIAEREKAQEKLLQLTAELERSNAELQQFAYIASHDLQEPLRMITSYLQLLVRKYADKLDNEGMEFIDFAVDGAKRMQKLINDLLAYSRVHTRAKPPRPTNLEAVLKQTLQDLKAAIDESNAQITWDPLPTVMVDDTQLGQLLLNLLSNAIKYRSERPLQIHISARREGDQWVISVADNGIGIDPKYFDRIFAVFQRLHTRAEYPGTGIGLAICKRIVERHGGRIWVESEPGKGSIFYFSLPAVAPRNSERGKPSPDIGEKKESAAA